VRIVRDDPDDPDPGFAELYAALPFEVDLEPWLSLARAARPPVLYLGVGTGRLAVPLARAGIDLVGVEPHPGMLEVLQQRLPQLRTIQARLEDLVIDERFDLVIAPSHLLSAAPRLAGATRLLAPRGRLALELMNPHWLAAGDRPRVRVRGFDGKQADIEVDYPTGHTHLARVALVWPEQVEEWLARAGLRLVRLGGGDRLASSPSFHVVATMAR